MARRELRAPHPGLSDWIRFFFLLLSLSNMLPVVGGEVFHPGPALPPFDPGAHAPPGGAIGTPGPGLPAVVQSHVHYVANQTAAFNQTLAQTLARHPGVPAGTAPPRPAQAPVQTRDPQDPPEAPVPGVPPPQESPAPGPGPAAPSCLAQAAALAGNIPIVNGTAPAAATLAGLSSRLALAQQWVAQELEQVRPLADGAPGAGGSPPLLTAMTTQLVALDSVSAGLQGIAAGYLAQVLSPAEAIGLVRQASDTLINIVNSFRVAAQSLALTTYSPRLEQIHAEMERLRDRILADLAHAERAWPDAAPARAPETLTAAQQSKACCDYADLMAHLLIQRILGAGGAANVAAYTVAEQAAAEEAGIDVLRPVTTLTAQARALLAATDATAVSAAIPGSQVLVPPAGAIPPAWFPGPGATLDPSVWANTDSALASRCGAAQCDQPITRARAVVAGVTLSGSVMNLIGFTLYSVAVQMAVAMELESGSPVTVQHPAQGPGNQTAWFDALMQEFHAQARGTLPERSLARLLGAVPGPTAADGSAFPGIRPGMGDAEILGAVLHSIAQTIHQEYWPTLSGIAPGTISPSSWFAGLLSRFHWLASAGLEQRGLAASGPRNPAAEAKWQVYANLATYSRYAAAVAEGRRSGALDPKAALTLLGDLADTLQALVYGWLIEASAVPLEASLLYQQGALPHLTQARARALGMATAPGAGSRRCQDWCRYSELRTQAATEETARTATRIYLAAYIEALIGSIITQAVDVVDSFGSSASTGNGTWSNIPGAAAGQAGRVQAESAGGQDAAPTQGTTAEPTQAVPFVPAAPPARAPLEQAALEALLAEAAVPRVRIDDPEARLEEACAAEPCDLTFSRQETALAEESRSGSELTFLAYTLGLVVKGFRIALAAGR